MSFSALAALWDVVAPPLRPSAEDLQVYARHAGGRVLVLGATQELLALSPTGVAVDRCEEMVARVRGRVLVGDWCAMPLEDGSVDSVLGDGSLSAMGSLDERQRALQEVRRVLAPGGRVTLRTYTRTDDAGERGARSINAMKVRLWGQVAREDGTVHLDEVWRAWSALPAETHNAFSPEAVASLECYRGSSAAYWVPTEEALLAFVAAAGFRVVASHRPASYELAERCPILTLEPSS